MTREEREKAIDALKISAPVMSVTQEEFNDYIQILNKIMNWLEQEPCDELDFVQPHKKVSVNLDPCVDAISRQAAIDAFNAFADEVNQDTDIHEAIEIVLNLPPVEQKQGEWIWIRDTVTNMYHCSCCRAVVRQEPKKDAYCRWCVAKMEGVNNENRETG